MIRLPPHVAAEALRRLRELEPGGRYAHLAREAPRPTRSRPRVIVPAVMRAEPISTFIGLSALINAGLGLAATAAIGGAIGGFIVSTTLSFGLSIAAKALSGSFSSKNPLQSTAALQSPGINDPAVSHNTRQTIPAKRIIHGTARVGGALFFEKVKPPYLYHGLLLCARRITSVGGMFIGANPVLFTAFTPGSILTPYTDLTGAPQYSTHLRLSLHLGIAPYTVDPQLAAAFASIDAQFKQSGNARAVLRYDFGSSPEDFLAVWGNVQSPDPNFLVDGVPVYDPRDPTQSRDSEPTWKFSNNAALVQADYLRASYGGRIRSSRVDWDQVARAADYDDELVGTLSGSFIKRHTIDGVISLDQSPYDIMTAMLSANRGFIHESGGLVWVTSSRPRDPVLTIHDEVLTGTLEFRGAQPKKQAYNRVLCQFVADDRQYQQSDGPLLDRTDLQSTDGEILEVRLNLPFTRDYRRAERLQKATLDTSRLGKTITCRCDIAILEQLDEELVGSAVRFDSVLFSPANGIYLVKTVAFSDNFSSIELVLSEYDKTIETSWVPASERPFTVTPINLS